MTRLSAALVVIAAFAAVVDRSAAADEVILRIDLSDPNAYELVQPLLRDCIGDLVQQVKTVAEANGLAPGCLQRVLLSSAELERQIRTYFPTDLTASELDFCIGLARKGDPMYRCVYF